MNEPGILIRPDFSYELRDAQEHFPVVRMSKQSGDGRYSVLPFYREIESDLAVNPSRLINSLG